MTKDLGIGSMVKHDRYGDGVVSDVGLDSIHVFFRQHGEKEFALDYEGFEVLRAAPPAKNALTLDEVESVMAGVLQKFADFTPIIPLGDKWKRGNLVLQPGTPGLQSKEIPIEVFFHKIVMVRDRVRVMEQQINTSNLSDEEKVNLQQYITRIYGSLTTFNVLFKEKEHHFVGEGRKRDDD
jgi:hypothetical protein